jgi:hypothetical protein
MLAIVNTFDALLSKKSDIKLQHMSGPVQIVRVYYILFENADGWRQAIWFSVILNVNLALLNLMPVPVLDGGHIVLAILEWIRRRPLNGPHSRLHSVCLRQPDHRIHALRDVLRRSGLAGRRQRRTAVEVRVQTHRQVTSPGLVPCRSRRFRT